MTASQKSSWLILASALLMLPLVAHWMSYAAFVWAATRPFSYGRVDVAIAVMTVIYAFLVPWIVRDTKTAMKVGLLLYSVLFAVGSGELLVRWRLPRESVRAPWSKMHRVLDLNTEALPGLERHVEFTIDALGVRAPEMPLEQADVKILCVGGSTTECMYVTDDRSWPWRMQQILSERLQRKVFVGNAGIAGQFTLHHEYQLRNYAMAKKFDWVVVLCGANDMGTLLRGDYEDAAAKVPYEALTGDPPEIVPGPRPYYRKLRLFEVGMHFYEARIHKNSIFQDSYADWIRDRRKERQLHLNAQARTDMPQGLAEGLERYRSNLRGIIDVCRGNHQHVLFLTQPSLYRADLNAEEQALLWQTTPNGTYAAGTLDKLNDLYNRALMEVCAQEDVDCIDLAAKLPKDETTFYDDFHFNISGCDSVAKIVAATLAQKCASPLTGAGANLPN